MKALGFVELFWLETLAALDGLPRRRLIRGQLRDGDNYCALGALLRWRAWDVKNEMICFVGSNEEIAQMRKLIAANDSISGRRDARWRLMRDFVMKQIKYAKE